MQKLITKYKETSPGRLCSWLKGNTIGPWGGKALLLDFSDWVAGPAVVYLQKTSTSTDCLLATVLGARNWKSEGPCSGLLVVHPLEGACMLLGPYIYIVLFRDTEASNPADTVWCSKHYKRSEYRAAWKIMAMGQGRAWAPPDRISSMRQGGKAHDPGRRFAHTRGYTPWIEWMVSYGKG